MTEGESMLWAVAYATSVLNGGETRNNAAFLAARVVIHARDDLEVMWDEEDREAVREFMVAALK